MYILTGNSGITASQEAFKRWGHCWGRYYDLQQMAEVWINDGPFIRLDEDAHGGGKFTLAHSEPLGCDINGGVIYAYTSLFDLPNSYFVNPTFSVMLPPFSRRTAIAAHSAAMPILLKKSIVERNTTDRHTDIIERANAKVLDDAIYNATYVLHDRPVTKPRYYVFARKGDYVHRATLDFIKKERRIEVVDWYTVSLTEFNAKLMKIGMTAGGFVQIVKPE